ncbi:hypothetical protein [Paraburkholderia sp. GAS348]|uniref:hypothetical protein n=1 Tax=Paraburkholderia sp. GAS348 TaxID=3035132 RepID=UPI003D193342
MAFVEVLSVNTDSKGHRNIRRHVQNAEDRDQCRSILAKPLSTAFGIPIRKLTTEYLTADTLGSLRERFGFTPSEVCKRGADFRP